MLISYLFLLAQCLHTITEDNSLAAQCLCCSSDLMKTLEKSLMADGSSSDMLLLKVLTAGMFSDNWAELQCFLDDWVSVHDALEIR